MRAHRGHVHRRRGHLIGKGAISPVSSTNPCCKPGYRDREQQVNIGSVSQFRQNATPSELARGRGIQPQIGQRRGARRMERAGGLLAAVPVGGDAEVQGNEGGCEPDRYQQAPETDPGASAASQGDHQAAD